MKTRLRQVCNDVPRIQSTEIPVQDFKQVPREECTSGSSTEEKNVLAVPVQKCNTFVNQQCSTVQRNVPNFVPDQKCNDVYGQCSDIEKKIEGQTYN